MTGDFMICMATYGSGFRIGMVIIRPARLQIQKDLMKDEAVCCAAVRGSATRGTYDRPIATTAILATAATTSVFELLGIYNLTIYLESYTH